MELHPAFWISISFHNYAVFKAALVIIEPVEFRHTAEGGRRHETFLFFFVFLSDGDVRADAPR